MATKKALTNEEFIHFLISHEIIPPGNYNALQIFCIPREGPNVKFIMECTMAPLVADSSEAWKDA